MIDHFVFVRLENKRELVNTNTALLRGWRTYHGYIHWHHSPILKNVIFILIIFNIK